MRRLPAALLTFGLVAGLGAGLTACGSTGRDLRVPKEGAVSPTRSVSTVATTAPTTAAPAVITLTSTAFPAGGPIPVESACNGPSPSLSWTGVTPTIKELVLVVVDPQADGFVHWLVTGIKPSNASIPKGQVPPGAIAHPNSAGTTGWTGPCPPEGETHTYNFILLGLTEPSALAPDATPEQAVTVLQTQARANRSVLSGTFTGLAGGRPGTVPAGSAVPGSAAVPTSARPASSTTTTTAP